MASDVGQCIILLIRYAGAYVCEIGALMNIRHGQKLRLCAKGSFPVTSIEGCAVADLHGLHGTQTKQQLQVDRLTFAYPAI